MFLIDDDYLYVIKWRLDIIINALSALLTDDAESLYCYAMSVTDPSLTNQQSCHISRQVIVME